MEQAAEIKKYGSNQGTFPALNLAPLYRLTDEAEKRMISDLTEGKTTNFNIEEIRRICRENNWGKKFSNKYRISMQDVPREMSELFQKTGTIFQPLQRLTGETDAFAEAENLHRALEHAAFAMLEEKGDCVGTPDFVYAGNREKRGGRLRNLIHGNGLQSVDSGGIVSGNGCFYKYAGIESC